MCVCDGDFSWPFLLSLFCFLSVSVLDFVILLFVCWLWQELLHDLLRKLDLS